MKEKISKADLIILENCMKFYEEFSWRSLKWGIGISLILPFVFLYKGLSIFDYLFFSILGSFLTLLIWYAIFGKKYFQTKKDIQKDVKITQTLSIKKIQKNKEENMCKMENGMAIPFSEFENDDISNIEIGKEVIVTYTPYSKTILKLKVNE